MKITDLLLLIEFLSGAAIKAMANDRARLDEIKDLSLTEIVELAKTESDRAVSNADDLKKTGHQF